MGIEDRASIEARAVQSSPPDLHSPDTGPIRGDVD